MQTIKIGIIVLLIAVFFIIFKIIKYLIKINQKQNQYIQLINQIKKHYKKHLLKLQGKAFIKAFINYIEKTKTQSNYKNLDDLLVQIGFPPDEIAQIKQGIYHDDIDVDIVTQKIKNRIENYF